MNNKESSAANRTGIRHPLVELKTKLLAEFTDLLVGADVSKLDADKVLGSIEAIGIDNADEGLLGIEVELVEVATYDSSRASVSALDLSKDAALLKVVY